MSLYLRRIVPALGLVVATAAGFSGCNRGADKSGKAAVAAPVIKPLTIKTFSSSEPNASVNSYLISGATDALLVDAQLVNSEATKLAAMVKASGKNLKWIYITHGHPDHFEGLQVLQKEFPNAELLARPKVVQTMPDLFKKYEAPLNKFFPGDVATAPVTPKTLDGLTLTVEGVEIKLLEFENGECSYATALHIPTQKVLFAADLVYNKVFPWLNEMHVDGVLKQAEAVKALPDVDTIYPGHGDAMTKADIPGYVTYVNDFLAMVETAKDADALVDGMKAKYPSFKTVAGLRFSANAHIAARDEKRAAAGKGAADDAEKGGKAKSGKGGKKKKK